MVTICRGLAGIWSGAGRRSGGTTVVVGGPVVGIWNERMVTARRATTLQAANV